MEAQCVEAAVGTESDGDEEGAGGGDEVQAADEARHVVNRPVAFRGGGAAEDAEQEEGGGGGGGGDGDGDGVGVLGGEVDEWVDRAHDDGDGCVAVSGKEARRVEATASPPGMATRRAQAAAMTRGRPMKKRGAWGVVAARSAAP